MNTYEGPIVFNMTEVSALELLNMLLETSSSIGYDLRILGVRNLAFSNPRV